MRDYPLTEGAYFDRKTEAGKTHELIADHAESQRKIAQYKKDVVKMEEEIDTTVKRLKEITDAKTSLLSACKEEMEVPKTEILKNLIKREMDRLEGYHDRIKKLNTLWSGESKKLVRLERTIEERRSTELIDRWKEQKEKQE